MTAIEYNVGQREKKRGPAKLLVIQGPLPSGSRKIHSNKLEIKQSGRRLVQVRKELLSEVRHKKKCTRGGSRDRLGMPRPTQS